MYIIVKIVKMGTFDNLQKYFVQYEKGTAGTLVTWFINQHENFPKCKFEVLAEHDICLDSDACQWRTSQQNKDDVSGMIDHELLRGKIEKHSKICFKTFPHCISNDLEGDNKDEVLQMFASSGLNKVIIPVVSRQTNYMYEASLLASRLHFIINKHNKTDDINVGWKTLFETEKNSTYKNKDIADLKDKYNMDIFLLDICALIAHEEDEYEKLCNFIDSNAIQDWKNVLDYGIQFRTLRYHYA